MKYKSILMVATVFCLMSLPALAQKSAAPVAPEAKSIETSVSSKISEISKFFDREEDVQLSSVPAAVKKTINANSRGAKVDAVEKENKHGKAVYKVKLNTSDNQRIKLKIEEDGTLTGFEYKCEEESNISFDAVSPAAQKTITANIRGGKVNKVEKENKYGETIYEVKATTLDNRAVELKVNKKGSLIELETEKGFF